MSNYPELIKEKLLTIIHKMAVSTMPFVKKTNKDFTRNRRFPFESVIKLILSMGGNSLYSELLNGNEYQLQHQHLYNREIKFYRLPLSFYFMNLPIFIRYKGYRLLAVDGSKLNIVYNAKDILIQDKIVKGIINFI